MTPDAPGKAPIAIAVHGGAGAIQRNQLTPALERKYLDALEDALRTGIALLARGDSAIEAVTRAVVVMEDSPLFNAGRGAVLNHDGVVELDAAIMEGRRRAAGAIAQSTKTKNPILLARAVMESSPHVMLAGTGADAFAAAQDLAMVSNSYFRTARRRRQLELAREREQALLDHDVHGTVGAVALDEEGNLAAATSTGGITNKRFGRVGDSPIIGAGTYADNRSCAVSATGTGEHFIRGVIAHYIAQRMLLLGEGVTEAAQWAVESELASLGGRGGVIAMDNSARIAMPFNTEGMYRGSTDRGGRFEIAIFP